MQNKGSLEFVAVLFAFKAEPYLSKALVTSLFVMSMPKIPSTLGTDKTILLLKDLFLSLETVRDMLKESDFLNENAPIDWAGILRVDVW